jgi:hypothetical protein
MAGGYLSSTLQVPVNLVIDVDRLVVLNLVDGIIAILIVSDFTSRFVIFTVLPGSSLVTFSRAFLRG